MTKPCQFEGEGTEEFKLLLQCKKPTSLAVLESDLNVFSAYGSGTSAGVSLLVGRSLDADVDVVFAGDGGRLVVAIKVRESHSLYVHIYNFRVAA